MAKTNNKNLKQFTSERQPTPWAKSQGVQKWWDRRKLADSILKEFAMPILADNGKECQPHEKAIEAIKHAIVNESSTLSPTEKADIYLKFFKLIDLVSTEPMIEVSATIKTKELTELEIRDELKKRGLPVVDLTK